MASSSLYVIEQQAYKLIEESRTKMVDIRFTSVVVGLLFSMYELGEFYAHAYQGQQMIVNEPVVAREDILSSQTELYGITVGTEKKMKIGIGGRKLVTHIHSQEVSGTSVSGEEGESITKHEPNNQLKNMEKRMLKSVNFATRRMNKEQYEVSEKLTGEKQRIADAEKELASLMHRDYNEPDKPRCKPPTNNSMPKH